jgi:hypothetical protein
MDGAILGKEGKHSEAHSTAVFTALLAVPLSLFSLSCFFATNQAKNQGASRETAAPVINDADWNFHRIADTPQDPIVPWRVISKVYVGCGAIEEYGSLKADLTCATLRLLPA